MKILRIGEGGKRVSVTLMGNNETADKIVTVLKEKFGSIQVRPK